MKKIVMGLVLISGFLAKAETNCTEHNVLVKVKKEINSFVGKSAGENYKVLKEENIDVLTTEDNAGNIQALLTFDQTLGDTVTRKSSFIKMKGYMKFEKDSCKQIDGLMLGSSPAK